ncbi:hypothetical protein N9934_04875, partial [Desulfosarcina sp.]|nr:hypothetical protein [Desulfosarcina sp.]
MENPDDCASKLLTDTEWQVYYSHEHGNLVDLFYTPALSSSCKYQRVTGYFTANALAMASKGLLGLIRNQGTMQLIVGCTLGDAEIEQIDAGYKLRDVLATTMAAQLGLATDDETMREKIGWLSWMVAKDLLDVKLAVPKDENGHYVSGLGIYHAKAGIMTDTGGNQLVFTGSINETKAAWKNNWESFSVSCSWRGEWDAKRVDSTVDEFGNLWQGNAKSAKIVDFPEAVRDKLFQFMPKDDSFLNQPSAVKPICTPGNEVDQNPEIDEPSAVDSTDEVPDDLTLEERRQAAWQAIVDAPNKPDGEMVAVITSTV